MKGLSEHLLESLVSPGRIFIIIKPGFLNKSQEILQKFEEIGWKMERQVSKKLLEKEAKSLYKIHKKEDWYDDLVKYMSSDLSMGVILVNDNIKMSKSIFEEISAVKDNIRAEMGESEMRNVIHSSDSYEHMREEAGIYFSYLTI